MTVHGFSVDGTHFDSVPCSNELKLNDLKFDAKFKLLCPVFIPCPHLFSPLCLHFRVVNFFDVFSLLENYVICLAMEGGGECAWEALKRICIMYM